MNKRRFLSELDRSLAGLRDDERKRQLDYYSELIDDMTEDGMDEETAVDRLGSAKDIAMKILRDASPEQLGKKKRMRLIRKILIVLGVLCLAAVILSWAFAFRPIVESGGAELDDIYDIEDWAEHLIEGNWTSILDGSNLEVEPSDINGMDIYWELGGVTVGETEGNDIIVSVGGIEGELIRYEYDDDTLYISSPEMNAEWLETNSVSRKIELRVLFPEDRAPLYKLSVATADNDVSIDCECLDSIRVVTASGDVIIRDNDASSMSLCTASGDITAEIENSFDKYRASADGEDEEKGRIRVTSASGDVRLIVDDEMPFKMDYASCTGKVSVGFDRSFTPNVKVGQNGEAIYAEYDHSLGRKDWMILNIVTSSGDISLVDD